MKKERKNEIKKEKKMIGQPKIQYYTHKNPSVELPLSYLNPV
jgi:hypothetical protein